MLDTEMQRLRTWLAGLRPPRSHPARILLAATAVLMVLTLIAVQTEHGSSRAAAPGGTAAVAAAVPSTEPTLPAAAASSDGEGAVIAQPTPQVPQGAHAGRFTLPLKVWTKVTDRFGAPRGNGRIHGGIDLALDTYPHSNVYSACKGSVQYTGYSATYGNHVIIDCGDSWTTLYAHLSRILVTVGQPAAPSLVIGISGSTGYSTGEHLHFEIRYKGVPLNPEDFLDFHIAPGTPLSDGPIVFPGSGTSVARPGISPTATTVPPTDTPTITPTPTATHTPTPTPTSTPTPTPTPRPRPRATPTPPSAF